jgi:hypothetical protein
MSTSHPLLDEDDLSGMVTDLKRWPNVAIDHGPFELAVTPYLTFYFTYEPVHFLQATLDMVDVHTAFEALLGNPYLIATHPDSERPHPYGSKKLGDLREWIKKTPVEETFTVKFTDEENHQSSPTHAAYLWREPTLGQREQCYSSIQFYYRWQWWLDNKEAWRKFVLDTIARLKPAQVYSGFSMANPLEFGMRSEVAVWDRALAPHFYGLDTDYPFGMMFTPDLPSGIRPPTWGFFLSDVWRKKLSMTREDVAAHLHDSRIRIDTLSAGQWIELGQQPELYPVETGLPELPVMLNRMLRRIRHPQLDLIGSGEWDGDPNERFNRRDTQRWLARFDDDSDWPTPEIRGLAPRDPLIEPTPSHVIAGEPIPTKGWWYTLAKHGSRQHFKAGDLAPQISQGASRGRVIWQRDIDQDAAKAEPPSLASPGAVRVRSGEPCPYPGIWVCEDEPGAPQPFAYQTPMPQVNGRDVCWAMVKFLR